MRIAVGKSGTSWSGAMAPNTRPTPYNRARKAHSAMTQKSFEASNLSRSYKHRQRSNKFEFDRLRVCIWTVPGTQLHGEGAHEGWLQGRFNRSHFCQLQGLCCLSQLFILRMFALQHASSCRNTCQRFCFLAKPWERRRLVQTPNRRVKNRQKTCETLRWRDRHDSMTVSKLWNPWSSCISHHLIMRRASQFGRL